MLHQLIKKIFFLFCCVGVGYTTVCQEANNNTHAPAQLGFTGLIYTPSAYLNPWKTVDVGFTHISKETSFTYLSGEESERAFIATMAFLPFAELSIKLTRPYSNVRPDFLAGITDVRNWGIGDRSYSVRVQLLKETEKQPAILIGTQDPIGNNFFRTNYLVFSKSKTWNQIHFSANAGYGWSKDSRRDYLQGAFGGVQATWKKISGMVEYDTQRVNVGLGYQFKNLIFLNVALIDVQYFSGNISFRFSLK